MPEYSFRCSKKKCSYEFEEICSFSDFDNNFVDVKCPECGKKKPNKIFVVNRVHSVGGSDKMNNFEYAAEKNMERAQIESHTAREEAAKKGINSYNNLPDFTDNGRRMNFID